MLELAIQKAIYKRLTTTSEVLSLVPLTNILDRNQLPKVDPLILIGNDQLVEDGSDVRRCIWRVFSTLDIWKVENGLTGSKAISGAIRQAIRNGKPELDTGYHCVDWYVSTTRFLRDPDGGHSHGVLTIESLVLERQP
ncbi:DUF3168 domain-containing protein [Bartonella sp. M0193]|uniref:DUF3168 domain-containing protein n=1 Tax=Bartonella TaxID=773 RepID=UPI0018DB4381|nr:MULTISPECIES: DUF3168 domain-containing protein [Bartonella]MBI0008456.1 DUF3168 domain-containing protein [Bartonella sp. M0193]MBI0026494.1 DUF3168 domain-containing protein [Bartonella apihabitans]